MSAGSGFLCFFSSGRMSFLVTPNTTQNFFIHVLNSAGSFPSNFLRPLITVARFVELLLANALPPPVLLVAVSIARSSFIFFVLIEVLPAVGVSLLVVLLPVPETSPPRSCY